MWRKFFVAILSIVLLSSVAVSSQQLFANSISKVEVKQAEHRNHYIHEDVPFSVTSQNEQERILYVSGGVVVGNSEEYSIPLQDSADFTLKDISKPGVYQGSVDTQVSYTNQNTMQSVSTDFSFTIYGKAFQQEQYTIRQNEEMMLPTFGTLPEDLQAPRITFFSADETVVKVDDRGYIKAVNSGSTTIDVQVLDDTGVVVSKSSCKIVVTPLENHEVNYDKAIPGEDYDYRFIEMETRYEGNTKDSVVGSIHLGQSGAHTYHIDKENEETLRIEDNNLILNTEAIQNTYNATVYVTHEESKKTYKIAVSYTIHEKKNQEEDFLFRYSGESVNHIIHAYKAGANNFQIASNQAIGEVFFQLKNQEDSAYLTVSQTGNVSIKKVTEKPVVIQATWKKKVFELPVVIEKAEQVISQDVHSITVSVDDGAFEPMIKGNQGSGTLVLTSSDTSVASITMSNDKKMSIQPKTAGKTIIELCNQGDENYKKSNILRYEVNVIEKENTVDIMNPQSNWLLYSQVIDAKDWHSEDVHMSINPEVEQAREVLYQGAWVKEFTLHENGTQSIPLLFRNEAGSESSALMLQIAIDTHAPLITQMSEDSVTDTSLKQYLNQATFQKAFGTGMKIRIAASDLLANEEVKVSGVDTIKYRIYALEDGVEELLVEDNQKVVKNQIEVVVDDTRPHRVCATASDLAGLTSKEICRDLNNEEHTIASKHSGILLRGRSFQANAQLEVEDVLDKGLLEDVQLDENVEVKAALKLSLDEEASKTDSYSIIIPLRKSDDVMSEGVWKQQGDDGGYQEVESTADEEACIISTNSLNTLVYVQEKDKTNDLQSLRLTNTHQEPTTITPSNVVNNAFQTTDFDVTDIDSKSLIWIGGSMFALLLAIILIRGNRDENFE